MDSLQKSLADMSTLFTSRMEEFQRSLERGNSASTATNTIFSEFESFRSFILFSLKTLNEQVQMLFKLHDQTEMRTRRKIILVHGIKEEKNEDIHSILRTLFTDRLKLTDIGADVVTRCHRLGISKSDKPRPILVKFNSTENKNLIWYNKVALRNTGITMSEFLTKYRHDIFLAARKQFGVNKCWTKDGHLVIVGSDGQRYGASSIADLNLIPKLSVESTGTLQSTRIARDDGEKVGKALPVARPKRVLKNK